MKRTTIFADDEIFLDLKRIAQEEGKTVSEIIRQALQKYIHEKYTTKKAISLIGIGRSGRRDISERCEQLLWKGQSK